MVELFVINDWETEKPMYYYLTTNALECYDIMAKVDKLEDKDDWQYLFEEMCAKKGIKLQCVEPIEYNY